VSETLQGGTDAGAYTGHAVRLDGFQGPLDLLLHLIRTEAIDVAAIPILEIARQYGEYLDALGEPDFDTAGDYLVMAATLVHMKSRRLLPVETVTEPEPSAADDGPSPTAALPVVRRAAEHLQEREAIMEMVYQRPHGAVAEFAGEQGIEADLYALLRAFQAILRRVGEDATSRVSRERITLVERINWLMDALQRQRRIGFRSLFEGLPDRLAFILTFLALLEVIRLRLVRAFQSHHQEDIIVMLVEDAPPAALPEEPADA
jgi:segregation and condensation protein A